VILLTWAASELVLTWLKTWFHRGRPPGALVETVGYSFPSGHAVAGAATAVALVLAFMPAGHERRVWEWIAAAFAFVMAFSRVYRPRTGSDMVAGVLLGSRSAPRRSRPVRTSRARISRGRTLIGLVPSSS
jgi:undecaprenyl-diphosphatase